jgi:hypothetical protein
VKTKKFHTVKRKVQIKAKCSGHAIESNIWFRLGLSKTEASMLKAIAFDGNIFVSNAPSAFIARALLQAALAHFNVLKPLIIQNITNRTEEGFSTMDGYIKGVIAHQRAKILGAKGAS